MGETSSCINDIANDELIPILHDKEVQRDESVPKCSVDMDNFILSQSKDKVPIVSNISSLESDESPSNDLSLSEFSNNNSLQVPQDETKKNLFAMKSSGSDVSISFFLDREHIDNVYDDDRNFASVNSNIVKCERKNKINSSNVTFQLNELG